MTLPVAITPLLLVDDSHLYFKGKNTVRNNIFIKTSYVWLLLQRLRKTKLASWSVCDDCFTATKRNYLQHFIANPTVQMCTTDLLFHCKFCTINVLQTVAIKHCILQHFHGLPLPQKPTDIFPLIYGKLIQTLVDLSWDGIQGSAHGVIGLEPDLHSKVRVLSPSRVQNCAKLFNLIISFREAWTVDSC